MEISLEHACSIVRFSDRAIGIKQRLRRFETPDGKTKHLIKQICYYFRDETEMYKKDMTSPPDLKGGTFVSFGPGGDACQQRAKYAIPINNLSKIHNKGERLAVWGKNTPDAAGYMPLFQ